jgi:hypothetical protein
MIQYKPIKYDRSRMIDGLPSVTDILSIIDDPYHIKKWKESVGEDVANLIIEQARNRGNHVHKRLECYYRNEVFVPPEDLKIHPFLVGAETFIALHGDKYEPILIEERIISKDLGYHGKPDLLVKSKKDGKVILWDYKTSSTSSFDFETQKKYKIQCEAYIKLCENKLQLEVSEAWIIPLTNKRKSGLGDIVYYKDKGERIEMQSLFNEIKAQFISFINS